VHLKDKLVGEERASLSITDPLASKISKRNLAVTREELARLESHGSAETINAKELAYESALQRYQHRLQQDARSKTGLHPRLIIDVQVEIDGVLQPKLQRLSGNLTSLIDSPLTVPTDSVNEKLKTLLEQLDAALLDARDTTAIRQAIDTLNVPSASDEAVLYAPLHEARLVEEFQSPTRITATTLALKEKRDRLRAEERYAEAQDVQRKLNDLTYTQPDSKKVSSNIQTLLSLVFANEITIAGKNYVVGAHEWLKSKYRPFGFQLRRREIAVRVVKPPNMHLSVYQKLLTRYASAIEDDVDVPDVVTEEALVERDFIDATPENVLSRRDVESEGQVGGAKAADYSNAILSGIEAILNAPTAVSKKSGLTHAIRSAARSSALLGAAYETFRSDPINPYAIFRQVLTDRTQYGTFKNISWNTHVGRYARIPTQEGKCRAFIYEYLAYRVSIYNDFFQLTRYSGYADLPFMIGTRKNSDLLYKLLNSAYDQKLKEPLTSLLQKWMDYDKRVYHRAARLMHYDALILRFLCREVLLRTLTETACALNILAVKLLMRQAAACENRDKSFRCLEKLFQMAAKLAEKPLDNLPTFKALSPQLHSPFHPVNTESPLMKALAAMNYKVNQTPVTLPAAYPTCPEVPNKGKFKNETGRYISLLEDTVEKMKLDPAVRLYLSFSHATPCAELTYRVLTAKLELYEERILDITEAATHPRTTINELNKILEASVLDGARDVLTGKKPMPLKFEFEPDLIKYLTEFKCKSHRAPEFDSWYAELNTLHASYATDLATLYEPVEQLVRVVHDLYESDTNNHPFDAFNQLDYAMTAYDLLEESCSSTYDTSELDYARKPRDLKSTEVHLRTLLDRMDGAPRAVAPPEIQLISNETSKTETNTDAIFKILTETPLTEESFLQLDLHLPIRISAKEQWKQYLRLKQTDDAAANDWLAKSGDLKSNAYAAHELYEAIPDLIYQHEYELALRQLRTVLSFNVYQYNWPRFFKLPTFHDQKEQLRFLLDDMSVKFREELRTKSIDELSDDKEATARLARAYKATIDARLKQTLRYMYVLNLALGNRSAAKEYQKRWSNPHYLKSYYAALDASRGGQSVFDLRTTFRSTSEYTVARLVAKVKAFEPTTKSCIQHRLAFLLQFDKLSWMDERIVYADVIERLSPNYDLSRLVQHISTALFPDATDLEAARTFVSDFMYTYRRDPPRADSPDHGDALIRRAIEKAPYTQSNLDLHVDREVDAFAPSTLRAEASQYLQRSVRARENLWPGEKKSILSQFTENLPYLDGEYTLNILVRVRLLSETNELVILKNKANKNCPEKGQEVKLLRQFLFESLLKPKKAASVPSAPK